MDLFPVLMYAFIVIVPLDTVALVAVAVQGRGGKAQRGEETSRYEGLSSKGCGT